MLRTRLQHPAILQTLAAAGHGAQILITDGHYPASTRTDSNATRIYLNLAPDLLSVTDILSVLADTLAIEEATVMAPPEGQEPAIFQLFRQTLPANASMRKMSRFEFYDHCIDNKDLCLVLVSGDTRQYANILLTFGVTK